MFNGNNNSHNICILAMPLYNITLENENRNLWEDSRRVKLFICPGHFNKVKQEWGSGTVYFAELFESKFWISWVFKWHIVQFMFPQKNILLGNQCEIFKFRIFTIDTILLLIQYSQSIVKFYQVKLSQYIHLEIKKKCLDSIQKHILNLLVMY